MSDCIFCDIVDEEESTHRIYEDEESLAFLDIEPTNPGHVLVVPTAHYETLTDMEETFVGSVFQTAWRIADAIESACNPDGINIVQSNGTAAGQEIFHAHVHVVPRYEDDDVTLHWASGDSTEKSNQEVAAALRSEL
ncbi:HIT family protein [Natronolimnobius baerhuensis]|uniref:Diadenosine tetraphosphate hydrolase n=1 Tax=Natronolimnobius baerhuensis TaxID=253108 RepID=A0A202E7K5_9EURY|nr:HIT family protein [Natronolimnobius baerhuensis]OVE84194.1 diadenosine tetraphosphate hydrolase [Natronolimnobius baerhuensis]